MERCAPPTLPMATLLFLAAMKTPRKRPVWEKIRKSGTASLIVILFNNATAGGTVNLKISQTRLNQRIIPPSQIPPFKNPPSRLRSQ